MAPSYSRQLLVFAIPTIAVLLSYFWFKRKRSEKPTDPGDFPIAEEETSIPVKQRRSLAKDAPVAIQPQQTTPFGSPESKSPKVLSTPSTPIDIIIPRELRSQKTSPIVISDEDLDIEIEKIKSMRSCSVEQAFQTNKISGVDSLESTSQICHKIYTPKATKFEMPITRPEKNCAGQGKKKPVKMTSVEDKLNSLQLTNGNRAAGDQKAPPSSQPKLQDNVPETETETKPMMNGNSADDSAHAQETHEELRQSSERDSANHSPTDVMLASPSLSCISDNHSEGSSDSGKGGSDVATPPSRTPAGDTALSLYYEFTIPQTLVGKLIGRFGSYVAEIRDKTHAHIVIKKHPTINKLKLCVIEGSQGEIDKALKMIRERFPLKKHPEMSLEQVALATPIPNVPLTSDHLYSKLVEGVNNDCIVSCMVTPGHLFLQQPTHPSYPHLQVLSRYMTTCYNNPEAPILPKPIQENSICVAHSVGEWYRAMIISTDEATDQSCVTFLDYGGFALLPNSELKQIRGDFLLLPFQAAECYLSNVKPVGGDDAPWCEEAYTLVAELTKGAIALTQIAEYTETGVPLVLVYILIGPQEVIFLNDELVKRGYAEYIMEPMLGLMEPNNGDDVEGAVGGIEA